VTGNIVIIAVLFHCVDFLQSKGSRSALIPAHRGP